MKNGFILLLIMLPLALQAQSNAFVVTPDFFTDCHESRITLMDTINKIIDNNDIFVKIDVTFPLGFKDNYIGPRLDDFGDVTLVPYSGLSLIEAMIMVKSPLMNDLFSIGAIFSWNAELLGMGNDRSSKYSSVFVGGFFDIPGKLRVRCGTSVDETPVIVFDPVSGIDYFAADGEPQIRYFDLGLQVFDVGVDSIFNIEAKVLLVLGASYLFNLAGLDISSFLKYFGQEDQLNGIIDIEKKNFRENVNISGSIGLLSDLPVFSYIKADAEFTNLGELYLKTSINYILKRGEAENVFGGKIVAGYKPKHLQSDNFMAYYYVSLSWNDIGFLNTWSVPGDVVLSIGSNLSADPW